jgi:hypothetical protein
MNRQVLTIVSRRVELVIDELVRTAYFPYNLKWIVSVIELIFVEWAFDIEYFSKIKMPYVSL